MAHDHAHHNHAGGHAGGHSHAHAHGPVRHDRAFALAIGLNMAFVVAEAGAGLAANSVALLADAAHNLLDVSGLALAWGADWLGRKPPSGRRTYGYGRTSIMAALTNAAALLVAVGAIALEGVRRLLDPEPVAGTIVLITALVGIAINGGTALLFLRGRDRDINIRGAYLHLAADAGVSLGVVIAALVIMLTGWQWIDPVTSFVISGVILAGTWGLLRSAMNLAIDAVPDGIDLGGIDDFLRRQPGVMEVHDLHVWALSTTETALTVHLVMPHGMPCLPEITATLRERFRVGHATIQVETPEIADACRQRPAAAI